MVRLGNDVPDSIFFDRNRVVDRPYTLGR